MSEQPEALRLASLLENKLGGTADDDLIRMAKEAGLVYGYPFTWANPERFAALVAAAEREACARVCDLVAREIDDTNGTATYCAKAIRARGESLSERTPQVSDKTEQRIKQQTTDYLDKCPNCGGPADNGFDRSWPDPNPYYCTKCMKAGEY